MSAAIDEMQKMQTELFDSQIKAMQKAIQTHINNKEYGKAVSYLQSQIQKSKIYEEQAALYREKSAFGAEMSSEQFEAFREHRVREDAHKTKKDNFEKMALDLGERLTSLNPKCAIKAYQLIQYIGYYMEDIQEEVGIPNAAYVKAQAAIAKIYSCFLEEASISVEEHHKCAAEVLRATYNAEKGVGQEYSGNNSQFFSKYIPVLSQYWGLEVAFPSEAMTELANKSDAVQKVFISKIYVNIMEAIRNSFDSLSKGSFEKTMIDEIQTIFLSMAYAKTVKEHDGHKIALLDLLKSSLVPKIGWVDSLKSYISPKLNASTPSIAADIFSDFDRSGVTGDFLSLTLPLYLGDYLWKLKHKTKAVAKNSGTSTTSGAPAASTSALASQSGASASAAAGTAIVTAYTASASNNVVLPPNPPITAAVAVASKRLKGD